MIADTAYGLNVTPGLSPQTLSGNVASAQATWQQAAAAACMQANVWRQILAQVSYEAFCHLVLRARL